jgi:type VII secretion protein EccE
MTTAAQAALQSTESRGASRAAGAVRPRWSGSRVGPLPVVNLVVLEGGLALALALFAVHAALCWAVLLITVPLALGRWQGYWLVRWVQLSTRYLLRSRSRHLTSPQLGSGDPATATPARPVAGCDDPRLDLLRLLLPDLRIAHGTGHHREPLGLAWHQGTWTAVLEVDTAPSMIATVGGGPSLPLGALACCLEDRGVVLDAIQVIWHGSLGGALPSSSPALRSYLEVVGPLPTSGRASTWVAVRLDPVRCPSAVAERGGGVMGAHRALIGALSRVRSTLESRGLSARALDAEALVRAGIRAAALPAVAGRTGPVTLSERWRTVTAAGVGHASYVISGWGTPGAAPNLSALTGVRALSATVALSLSPGEDGTEVGLRGLVRLSARNPEELQAAELGLRAASQRLGVVLSPLPGLQVAGLAATLPLGAPG